MQVIKTGSTAYSFSVDSALSHMVVKCTYNVAVSEVWNAKMSIGLSSPAVQKTIIPEMTLKSLADFAAALGGHVQIMTAAKTVEFMIPIGWGGAPCFNLMGGSLTVNITGATAGAIYQFNSLRIGALSANYLELVAVGCTASATKTIGAIGVSGVMLPKNAISEVKVESGKDSVTWKQQEINEVSRSTNPLALITDTAITNTGSIDFVYLDIDEATSIDVTLSSDSNIYIVKVQ